MASSSSAGQKVADLWIQEWSPALRERLGNRGCLALAYVLEERDEVVISVVTERFERRLSEECGKLRYEIQALGSELRADFRVELANVRADFIKWSFLFWIGQAVTVVGTVAGLLVTFR